MRLPCLLTFDRNYMKDVGSLRLENCNRNSAALGARVRRWRTRVSA